MIDQPPPWSRSVKITASIILLITCVYFVYITRVLIVPLFLSVLVAYLLSPIVHLVYHYSKLPLILSLTLVYVIVITSLVTIPVRVVPRLVAQANFFIASVPSYIDQGINLAGEPITLPNDEQFILTDVMPVETIADRILDLLPSLSAQSFNVFGSLASYTAITVGWLAFVLFVSFYLIKDADLFLRSIVSLVPAEYESEMYQLAYELNAVWNAFLRGQFTIALIMGSIVFIVASIIGLPYALLIALIAAVSEFLPQIGPFVVLIPMTLIATFQSDQSWLGALMSPIGFALVIGSGYIFINQMANYFLYPKVLGISLNLHPLVVFVGTLGGFFAAGVVGVLLASPLIASGRVIFAYVYRKILDQPVHSLLPHDPNSNTLSISIWGQSGYLETSQALLKAKKLLQYINRHITNIDRSIRTWMKKWMLKP